MKKSRCKNTRDRSRNTRSAAGDAIVEGQWSRSVGCKREETESKGVECEGVERN